MRKITIALLGLVLLTTLKHSAFSYLHITPVGFGVAWLDWAYSVLVVLVLDAAILYTSFRGRVGLARIAAVSVGALSLAAFMDRADEFTWVQWITVTVFSVIIPFLQYEFAEIFAQDERSESELDAARGAIARLEGELREVEDTTNVLRRSLDKTICELEEMAESHDACISELERYRAHVATNPHGAYTALADALQNGPVVLGHNKILIAGDTSVNGLLIPFEVVGNGDKRYVEIKK